MLAPSTLNMLPKFELAPINDVSRFLGDVDGRIDGNADIGGLERGTIVDAVAEKADHVPLAVQDLNDPFFLRRGQLGEHRRAFGDVGEFVLRHVVDVRAEKNFAGIEFHFTADLARDDFVVAGQNLHAYAFLGKRSYRGRRAFLGRVEKGNVPEQDQVALVGGRIDGLRGVERLVGHGHDTKTVRIERDRLFLCGGEVAFVEPAGRSVDLVSRTDCENFLDRPLANEDVLVRSLGHHHR